MYSSRSRPGASGALSRAARVSTRTMRTEPLAAASSGESCRPAATPGRSWPSDRSVTASSPSDGSTRATYPTNTSDGPTTSTPPDSNRLRSL